jgi:hypothetical protein
MDHSKPKKMCKVGARGDCFLFFCEHRQKTPERKKTSAALVIFTCCSDFGEHQIGQSLPIHLEKKPFKMGEYVTEKKTERMGNKPR